MEQSVRSQAPTIGDVSSKLMMGIREIAICKDPIVQTWVSGLGSKFHEVEKIKEELQSQSRVRVRYKNLTNAIT